MTDDGTRRFRRTPTPRVAFWDPLFDLWHHSMGTPLPEVSLLDLARNSNHARHLRATKQHKNVAKDDLRSRAR
jgi:hypothetical protein